MCKCIIVYVYTHFHTCYNCIYMYDGVSNCSSGCHCIHQYLSVHPFTQLFIVCIYLYKYVCLSFYLSVLQPASLPAYLFVCLPFSVCLPVSLSLCLFFCPFVCPSIHPFSSISDLLSVYLPSCLYKFVSAVCFFLECSPWLLVISTGIMCIVYLR